jgi:hypothetical protein
MQWMKDTVEMAPGDWNYGQWTVEQYQKPGRRYRTRGEGIWIVLWQNSEARKAWDIGRSGWEKLADFAITSTRWIPPVMTEELVIPWKTEQRLKRDIREYAKTGLGPRGMHESIVDHAKWEWFRKGTNIAGMEGFWLATRLMKYDPRDEYEISVWNNKIKMGPPEEEHYIMNLNGQEVKFTDKYWVDKL